MIPVSEVSSHIQALFKDLEEKQNLNGSWHFCFESGPMTDAFTIMLLRSMEINAEEIISKLANRIANIQDESGCWKLYVDEHEGNLTATVQAYNALLYSGLFNKSDPNMKKAESYIHHHGGLDNVHFMTKFMLAVNGQYPWPTLYIPTTLLLVPSSIPFNFFEFSMYARIHFIPMMICLNKRFQLKTKQTPNLDHLLVRTQSSQENWFGTSEDSRFFSYLIEEGKRLLKLPLYIHQQGLKEAENYMLARIEKDGTLLSYASATIFMVYSLVALGYPKNSTIIQNAIQGLLHLKYQLDDHIHIENSNSIIWDTALLSYSLQKAGIPRHHTVISKSISFLINKQQKKYGDWEIHNLNVPPGGWGFSNPNTINPDNDDTTAALRAITSSSMREWHRGLNWILSMQNRDGGWAAFEKNTGNPLLTHIPIENAKDAIIDPSTPDLTGRTLEFLGNHTHLDKSHPSIQKGVKWLLNHQEKNGSWYGRWGVCYIYGTWAAITGLRAAGVSKRYPDIQKAINWLLSIQNQDGGFGESCKSSVEKAYVPLYASTLSQTSWAVDALLTTLDVDHPAIQKGMSFLLNRHLQKEYFEYPTGTGLPGQFYSYYHSYNYIFPIVTMANYLKFT